MVNAALLIAAPRNKPNGHGDWLGEFSFEIPARRIAIVRKQGVDADSSLLRLELVDGIFRFSAFLCDGEDAESGDRLKGIVWLRMQHADAHRNKVPNIDENKHCKSRNRDSFDERARAKQKKDSSSPAK